MFLKVGEGLDELSMDDVVGNATIAAYKSAIAIRCCIKCNSLDPYRSFLQRGKKKCCTNYNLHLINSVCEWKMLQKIQQQ
ncbi:hypothetical protein ASG85_27380 [Paenibacillus sp. Soil724D2]|nr:hypothetical protein ASG85_27380 [Paenibacillus sp. Soil724D2]